MLTVTQLLNTADELEKRAKAFRLVARELQIDDSDNYKVANDLVENNEIVSVDDIPKKKKSARAKAKVTTISAGNKSNIGHGLKRFWASLSPRQRALKIKKMQRAKAKWLKAHLDR